MEKWPLSGATISKKGVALLCFITKFDAIIKLQFRIFRIFSIASLSSDSLY